MPSRSRQCACLYSYCVDTNRVRWGGSILLSAKLQFHPRLSASLDNVHLIWPAREYEIATLRDDRVRTFRPGDRTTAIQFPIRVIVRAPVMSPGTNTRQRQIQTAVIDQYQLAYPPLGLDGYHIRIKTTWIRPARYHTAIAVLPSPSPVAVVIVPPLPQRRIRAQELPRDAFPPPL
jgi:hypothetical protein